jgi:uncharacterized membrane protein YdjX (TVP38/TMEM64 family)
LKLALRLALAALGLIAIWWFFQQHPLLPWVVRGAKALHGEGLRGAFLTGGSMLVLTLLLAPIVPLIVATGWLYGIWGVLISLPAAVTSAATAFCIARKLGRRAAARALLERPKARTLADLAAEHGLTTVILVRISPLLPFTPSNAVMGLTPMRLRDIVLGTAIGMAPGIVLYSWAGSLLPSAEDIERGAPLTGGALWAMMGAAFAAAAILAAGASRRLRQLAAEARGGAQAPQRR